MYEQNSNLADQIYLIFSHVVDRKTDDYFSVMIYENHI